MAHVVKREPEQSGPYGNAVARLSTIGEALKRGDDFGAGPAPDLLAEAALAGLDALTAVDRHAAPAEASLDMVDRIRRELAEISGIAFR